MRFCSGFQTLSASLPAFFFSKIMLPLTWNLGETCKVNGFCILHLTDANVVPSWRGWLKDATYCHSKCPWSRMGKERRHERNGARVWMWGPVIGVALSVNLTNYERFIRHADNIDKLRTFYKTSRQGCHVTHCNVNVSRWP